MSVSRALSQLADALDEVVGDKVAEAIKESDALHDKVKDIMSGHPVDASDVQDLDDYIENWLDNHYTPTVEANNVDGLNSEIVDVVADKLPDILSEQLPEAIREHKFDVDDIQGLEDAVDHIVQQHVTNDLLIPATSVEGLDALVAEKVASTFKEVDWEEAVDEVIFNRVEQALAEKQALTAETLPEKLAQALGSPIFQAALDLAVKQALLRIVSSLFVGLAPQATPVVPPNPPQS